jgi:hypothetical protein
MEALRRNAGRRAAFEFKNTSDFRYWRDDGFCCGLQDYFLSIYKPRPSHDIHLGRFVFNYSLTDTIDRRWLLSTLGRYGTKNEEDYPTS